MEHGSLLRCAAQCGAELSRADPPRPTTLRVLICLQNPLCQAARRRTLLAIAPPSPVPLRLPPPLRWPPLPVQQRPPPRWPPPSPRPPSPRSPSPSPRPPPPLPPLPSPQPAARAWAPPPSTQSSFPSSLDWRDRGVVPPVLNQGACSSCYAFSAAAVISAAVAIATQQPAVQLSPKPFVDCFYDFSGCGEAWHGLAWGQAGVVWFVFWWWAQTLSAATQTRPAVSARSCYLASFLDVLPSMRVPSFQPAHLNTCPSCSSCCRCLQMVATGLCLRCNGQPRQA